MQRTITIYYADLLKIASAIQLPAFDLMIDVMPLQKLLNAIKFKEAICNCTLPFRINIDGKLARGSHSHFSRRKISASRKLKKKHQPCWPLIDKGYEIS